MGGKRAASKTPTPRTGRAKRATVAPATPVAASPAPVAHTIADRCAPILELISKAGDLPKPSFEMISAMLPHGFRTSEGGRHAYQTQLIERVAEALARIEAVRRDAAEAAEAKLAALPEEKAAASATLAAASEKAEAARTARDDKGTAVKEASRQVTEAREALLAAEEKVKSLDAERLQAQEEKADFEQIVSTKLEPLKSGSFPGVHWRQREKAINQVLQAFERLGVQESLKCALQVALKGKPGEHQKFARQAIEYGDNLLAKHLASLEEKLSGFEAEAQARKEAVVAAGDVVDKARERKDQGEDAFIAADNDLLSANEAKAEAAAALAAIEGRKTGEVAKEVDATKALLSQVHELTAQFEALRAGLPPPGTATAEAATEAPEAEADAPACDDAEEPATAADE